MRKFHVSEIIDELGLSRFTWRIFVLVGLAMIFDGFDYMIVSYTMPQIAKEWSLTKVQTGSLASWSLLGLIVGGAISGLISDRIGRKKTLVLSCLIYSLLTLPIYFVDNFTTFAMLRVLAGVGLGACIPVCSTLNSEFAPTRIRGLFVTSSFAWLVAGWVLAGLIAIPVVPKFGWRLCYIIGGIPLLYSVVLMLCLPESLHWLMSKGRKKDAIALIRIMECYSRKKISGEWSPESLIVPPPPKAVGIRALFSPEYRLATIGLWIMYFMGCIIVYGVTVWMPTLLYEKGFPLAKSYAFAVAQNIAALVANGVTGFVSDKLGRKKNIMLSFSLAAVAVVIMAYVTGTVQVLLACIFLGFAINFALTAVQPLITETYRTEFRNTGVGWTNAFGRIGGFLSPIMAGYVQQLGIGFSGTMLGFVIPAAMGIFAAMFFIKYETKGKTLEDIAHEITDLSAIR